MNTAGQDVAFGIDLAGYTQGKTVCAAAAKSMHCVRVTILQGCPLSRKRKTGAALKPIVAEEAKFLRDLISRGDVAVDVPVDLQGLPAPADAATVWQLTLRPIDRALKAMPPLADRIGAPTSRFLNILRQGGFENDLGSRLFETYPAGSLKCLSIDAKGYKGPDTKAQGKRRDLLKALGIQVDGAHPTDDELDATLCALTALAGPGNRLAGSDLADYANRINHDHVVVAGALPRGYILLKANPFPLTALTRAPADEWLAAHHERPDPHHA